MKRANKYAGANIGQPSVIGKHTPSPGYRPGQHWVECQRCGFDVYSEDIVIDGYSGLIVCKRCNDPKHPQDFVRPKPDKIYVWPVTGLGEYSRVGAVGSTAIPAATFIETAPTATDMPNVSHVTRETITPIDASTYFSTTYDDALATYTVDYFSADGLPDGLSMDPSTGIITGTLLAAADIGSPHSVQVLAVYTSGYVLFGNTWTWTITGVHPDDVTASLLVWWDVSEADGNYVFSDADGILPIADGEFIRRVNNRASGSGGTPTGTSELDTVRPRWNSSIQNGKGAMEPSIGPAGAIIGCVSSAGAWSGSSDPKTYIVVAKLPAEGSLAQWMCGPTASNGYNVGFSTAANGFTTEAQVMRTNPTPLNYTVRGTAGSWTLLTDDWFMFVFTSNFGTDATYMANNAEETPPWAPTTWIDMTQSSLRFGCGNFNTSILRGNVWKAAMGEMLLYDAPLTAAELAGLKEYFTNKWSLTSSAIP